MPKGPATLSYIGRTAPRGPQLPIYGEQTKIALRMLQLHEAAPGGFAPVAEYLSRLQEPDDRIDIVRVTWLAQLADTERLLEAFAFSRQEELSAAG